MPLDKYHEYLKNPNNAFPTTSQPAIGEVVACLEKLKEEGKIDYSKEYRSLEKEADAWLEGQQQ